MSEICEPINSPEVEQLFKWNTEPEDRSKTCEEIDKEHASIANNAYKTVDFIVTMLKDYFSDVNAISDDDLRNLLIDKEVEVVSMGSFDTDVSGALPKIVVEFCGKQSQQNFALENRFDYNIHNSSGTYYSHWQTGISVHVIGNTINETLLLAEEASKFFHCYQTIICKMGNFLRFQVAELSKPQYLEDSTQQKAFVCTLSLTIVTNNIWILVEQAPVLKRVTFKPVADNLIN